MTDEKDLHLEEEHEESNEKVELLEKELQEKNDQLLRTQADFANFKQRVEREKSELSAYSKMSCIEGLLPILDTFEQVIGHTPKELDGSDWLKGLEGFGGMISTYLTSLEVTPILITSGKTDFDPRFHEAVGQVEGKEGKVMEVLQSGYLFQGEKILRTAKVKVGM